MGSVKTISIIVAANIKGLENGLGKANKSLAKFASSAARMGSMMSFGITAPLTALGKSAFDAFANFEDGMMKVQAVTQSSKSDFKMLTDEAKRLGSTTEFTAQQVAGLQLVLGRKGFDATAIQNMEKSILDLALATGEDLSLAAEVVGASIKTFGMEASDTASIANTLASAAANSSLQLNTFATAFGHAGASASAVGVDIEELAAMMGVLMDNGIKASKAGTGLRKIFSKLHKEGKNFTEVLDLATQGELGLEKAMKIAGLTSGGQLLILAKNKNKVAELTEEYRTNTTRLDVMTKLMGSRAKAKVAIMNSAIEGLKIEMGALIYEAIIPVIEKITEWANAFKNLDDDTKNLILKVGGFLGVLGPVLIAIAALLSLLNPITGALLLLGTAFVALNSLTSKSESLIEKENTALNNLVDKLQSTTEGTQERLDLIAEIQTKYPNFLSNLDAEKIGNEDITKALKDTNTEFLKKLTLIAEQEKIQKLVNEKQAAGNKLNDNEAKAFEHLRKIKEKYNVVTNKSKSAQEQLNDLLREGSVFKRIKFDKNLTVSTLNGIVITESLIDELSSLKLQLKLNTTEFEDSSIALSAYLKLLDELGSTAGHVVEGTPSKKKKKNVTPTGPETVFSKSLIDWAAESDYLIAQTEALEGAAANLMATFSQGFVDIFDKQTRFVEINGVMVKQTLTFSQKFGSFVKDFLIGIAKMILQTAILAGLLTLTGLGSVAFAGQSAFGNTFKNLIGGAFANGGSPPVGKVSLVGEQGPELFVPSQSGTIIPNGSFGGGGATYIPNVTISCDDLLIVFDRANRRKDRR